MIIYPAIDIFGGKVVRLKRGDYEKMTIYSDNPVSAAQSFKDTGACALHVIDLEGAREGRPMNYDAIKEIAAVTGLQVQTGGGIRSAQSVEMYLDAGISRVILGTAAVAQDGFLDAMISKHGSSIAVSADIKDGMIAIRGWTQLSDKDVFSFCGAVARGGVQTIICTDISKDGMRQGSNIELYRTLREQLDINIIASGGVSSTDEVKTLNDIGINGVIIGKSLFEGDIDLAEALQAVQ